MASSLGQLGQPKVAPVDTFDWFEEEDITIGNVSSLVLIDFMDRAKLVSQDDVAQGLAVLRDAFRSIVAPRDFDRFWTASIANRQEADDLMALMTTLIELRSTRPTRRRSGSRSGPARTAGKSKAGSVSRKVQDRLERGGRADLAIAVRNVREAG